MAKETPKLTLESRLKASPEQVWEALTQPGQLQNWFPLKSGGDAARGGKVLLSWGADCEWETHITEFEPARHLQWCDVLPDPAQPEAILPVVDWHLELDGGATRLRLVQSGFDPDSDWQDYYDGLRRGWSYFLDMLACYLEHHLGRDRQMIYRRGASRVPRAELWSGLLGALGVGITAVEALESATVALNLTADKPVAAQVRLAESPYVFAARIPELNHASLFIELEGTGDTPTCGVWLSTFDLPDKQRSELQARLNQLCEDLLD